MAKKLQRAKIKIPEGYTPSERADIAEAVIAHIKNRSKAGRGVKAVAGKNGTYYRGYSLPKYSKEYAELKGQNNVDLTLSTEMLESIEYIKSASKKNEIVVGFKAGKVNNKAEGNQIGSYGGAPNSKKARSFLGATKQELKNILDFLGDQDDI